MDNNLILAPCSNEESKHNLRESVLNPVPEEVYSKYSDFRSEEDISIWGTKETNKGTWRLVEEGDVVLFYTGERTYEYAGTVAHTMVNRELANEVWGDGDQEYISSSFGPGAYKCLVFLTQVKKIDLDSSVLHRIANYVRDYPMQFKSFPEEGLKAIDKEYGSIQEFIKSET